MGVNLLLTFLPLRPLQLPKWQKSLISLTFQGFSKKIGIRPQADCLLFGTCYLVTPPIKNIINLFSKRIYNNKRIIK